MIGLITRGIRHVSRWLGGVGVQVQDLEKYLALSYKNIWHYYTKIFGMTTHLSAVLVQSTSTHVSKLSSANYGLDCNVAGILGKWGCYQCFHVMGIVNVES